MLLYGAPFVASYCHTILFGSELLSRRSFPPLALRFQTGYWLAKSWEESGWEESGQKTPASP